ncbi:endonuclease V [Labedaea rhizosphaerae]|uniref:Endonuclease V n=1 Tax=Labedaea rhizosphaerae TaxID=598644 RepID=A0A4R6SP01_LABRH|nr:endonuclease V [Labedaea rhizosphaerae]TDQ05300.1 endonuclease V [Labedaea rhizosphaerae]
MTDPSRVDEAIAEQFALRSLVIEHAPDGFAPRTAAGLDVAYDGDRLVAAACVVDVETLSTVESKVVAGSTDFPYVPGLFAYRELPSVRAVLDELETKPDVLVCDGHGRAHPRRFGLACHLGVLTGAVTVGVAKSAFGSYEEPGPRRGDWSPVEHEGAVVGRALRTQDGVKPVFVSIGHLIDLESACELVLRLAAHHRQPETTRRADHLCRQALRALA